jgi:hypothetical protein
MKTPNDGKGVSTVFDFSRDKGKCVIWDGHDNSKYYITDRYVFQWIISVDVYDRYSFERRERFTKDNNEYYKRIASFNIFSNYHGAADLIKSSLSFDPKTLIVTVNYVDKKDHSTRIDKFKFDGKDFVPVK